MDEFKYSPSTGGFYLQEIHGDNIPNDTVDVSHEYHSELMEAQAQGKVIAYDKKSKKPVASDPDPIPESDLIKMQIAELESKVTDRRLREALLGIDDGWLLNINSQISELRDSING